MRKTGIRMVLTLMLGCLLCLPAFAADEAPVQPEGQTLIMQIGSTAALQGGETISVPAPRYAANGAIQVPLRAVCDVFGWELTWDSALNQAHVDGDLLVFTQNAWHCRVNGRQVGLSTPVQNVSGTLYIPLQALSAVEGLYTHSFGFYEGAYLVMTDYALTEGDRADAPNAPYAADAPDEALAACREQALEKLGPNTGLFDTTAILLRCDSRQAYVGDALRELCKVGEGVMPQRSSTGAVLLPLEQTAQLCGWQSKTCEDGSITLSHGERQVAINPGKQTMAAGDCETVLQLCVIDGVLYCSVPTFRAAFDCEITVNSEAGFILITPYDVTARVDLQERAWAKGYALVLARYDGAKGIIALTFDDGPSGKITTRLLDGLKERGAHATFFLCDYRIRSFTDLMGRYLTEGHELGNHSANHKTLTAVSSSVLASELDLTSQSIDRLAGVNPVLMRPPGGAYNQTVLDAVGKRGMSCIMWSLDTLDWKNRNTDAIVKKVLGSVRDGDIILMHDLYATSVDAALRIVDALQAKGYVFVTVSELAEVRGIDLSAGSVYHKMPKQG